MRAERGRGVRLMMESHRLMKLPLETLYLSVAVYDRVLLETQSEGLAADGTELPTAEGAELGKLDFAALAVASLFSCHKL
jgi:hypothetical protein